MPDNNLQKDYILITSSNFPVGGAGANYLNLFCKGVKLNNGNISVLLLKGFSFGDFDTRHTRNNMTDYGVPFTYVSLIRRPKNAFYKILDDVICVFNLIIKLFALIPRQKETVVLVYNNEFHTNIIIYFFLKLIGVKIVTFVPEYYDKLVFGGSLFRRLKWYGFLFNFSFLNKMSYKLIVFSYYLKEQYIKQEYRESDIIIQPNLTDFDYWELKDAKKLFTIGYSGSPSFKDGLQDLFKAISILNEKGMGLSLLIVGDSPFGNSLIPDLLIECEKLGIEKNVKFTGLVELPMVKQYLSGCDILAITRPSTIQTQAGFPTKLGEYFASKKHVLVTNFGDIEKYFKKNVDVVMAQTGNPEDIAAQMQWMIEHKEEAERIRDTGYIRAFELLEYRRNVKRILDFIS